MRPLHPTLLCAFAMTFPLAHGGNGPFLQVGEHARSARGFVPGGWNLDTVVRGDLDGNGKPDLAMVFWDHSPEADDPRDEEEKQKFPEPPGSHDKVRILAVALADSKGYRLVAENDTIIPEWSYWNQADPFEGISIKDGKLSLDLWNFMTFGSWGMQSAHFEFGWTERALRLSGFRGMNFDRYTHGGTLQTFDAKRGLMVVCQTDNEVDTARTMDDLCNPPAKQDTTHFPPGAKIRLQDILTNGLDYDPAGGITP
ncbi:MAG: hypothetical protein IPK50_19600 [Fibrobacterota bacterium]|nr:hypothetical protein [Fibrobacterota bacterium]QQS04470.1 MAG: hypothetical protein IPK50_19600 [Fibrobacterota bacterium]